MTRAKLHHSRRVKLEKEKKPLRAYSRIMQELGERRSGSDSNAHGGRKKDKLHERNEPKKHHLENNTSKPVPEPDFAHDLNPHNMAGADHGVNQNVLPGARSAYDIKELYSILADLTEDELKSIMVLPEGTRLEQGAKYIDLKHLERGEFVALADMVAGPDNYYVAKKGMDYVLWNRLNQVEQPERLDETKEG